MKKEKKQEDNTSSVSVKQGLGKIFKNSGYKVQLDYSLKSRTGEEYNIDVYAEYEGPLHKDKIAIKCELDGSKIGENPILELDEILKKTEANKGIVICPFGSQSEAKELANERGIELLDNTDLPQLSAFLPETGPRFIEEKKDGIELDIYYSITGEANRNDLFSLTYTVSPKLEDIKSSFEKNNILLTNDAKVFNIGGGKSAVVEPGKIYFIEHKGDDDEYELNIYTYQGINLEDVEIELEYQITNRGEKERNDLDLTGNIISSESGKLEKIKIDDSRINKNLKVLSPNDSVECTIKISLPLEVFIKQYENLGLNIELSEKGKTIERRYFDLSSSEFFKNKFTDDLLDLENSLRSETKKSKESEHKNRPGCFIATAVYGDPKSEKIDLLRSFRDEILLEKKIGKAFTDIYYKVSPKIASWISKDESLRKAVGHLVVYPITDIAEKVIDREYKSKKKF